MNKYLRILEDLDKHGVGKMKCFGNSMTPILKTGSLITFEKQDEYQVGDIVFCKVNGRFIDAHKITKIDAEGRFLIANNHGWENGWTKHIFAKAIKSECDDNEKQL